MKIRRTKNHDKIKRKRFTRALLTWFKKNKREFPWRAKPSPYPIAVAEALLQKTAAANVVPVYGRVLERYPTVEALAASDLNTVAKMLEPLGLPRRALLMHQMATQVVSTHGGKFPETEIELRKLPGIGAYGAGAIASQAFGRRASMIDINVMKIIHRVFSMRFTPRSGPSKALRELVLLLTPHGKEAQFNLALLDFGALVCRSRNPRHDICPLNEFCDFNLSRLRHESTRAAGSGKQ